MWQLNAIELCLTDSANLIAHQSKSVKKTLRKSYDWPCSTDLVNSAHHFTKFQAVEYHFWLVSRQMETPKHGQIFLLEASMAILGWVLGYIRAAWGSYFLMRIAICGISWLTILGVCRHLRWQEICFVNHPCPQVERWKSNFSGRKARVILCKTSQCNEVFVRPAVGCNLEPVLP